jgi:Nickel responsive protein SCO4226-like
MQFALELYLRRQPESQSQLVARARSAATTAQRSRVPLAFLRSIYLPGDEICFLVFEAPSAEAVAEAARQADITFERVVEAELLPAGSAVRTLDRRRRT